MVRPMRVGRRRDNGADRLTAQLNGVTLTSLGSDLPSSGSTRWGDARLPERAANAGVLAAADPVLLSGAFCCLCDHPTQTVVMHIPS